MNGAGKKTSNYRQTSASYRKQIQDGSEKKFGANFFSIIHNHSKFAVLEKIALKVRRDHEQETRLKAFSARRRQYIIEYKIRLPSSKKNISKYDFYKIITFKLYTHLLPEYFISQSGLETASKGSEQRALDMIQQVPGNDLLNSTNMRSYFQTTSNQLD